MSLSHEVWTFYQWNHFRLSFRNNWKGNFHLYETLITRWYGMKCVHKRNALGNFFLLHQSVCKILMRSLCILVMKETLNRSTSLYRVRLFDFRLLARISYYHICIVKKNETGIQCLHNNALYPAEELPQRTLRDINQSMDVQCFFQPDFRFINLHPMRLMSLKIQ